MLRKRHGLLLALPVLVPLGCWSWFNAFARHAMGIKAGEQSGGQSYGKVDFHLVWNIFFHPQETGISFISEVREKFTHAILAYPVLIHASYLVTLLVVTAAIAVVAFLAELAARSEVENPAAEQAAGYAQRVIESVRGVLPDAVIYVYDNNSTDGTARIAKDCGAVVRHEAKQGKGNVIRRMFREIDAQCYIMIDGDDTYDVSLLPEMEKMVLCGQTDMVVGDRLSSTYFTENKRLFHNAGNRIVRDAINFIFHSDIRDIMTGLRAMSYEFVKTFPVLSDGFEIETEMTIHALNFRMAIDSVVVGYRDREEGSESKLATVPDGIRVIRKIFVMFKNYRPLAFFGLIAVVLALLGAGLFLPVLNEYLETGLVPRFPTLIASGFCMIAALQSFFGGVIMGVQTQSRRSRFEMDYIEAYRKKKEKM